MNILPHFTTQDLKTDQHLIAYQIQWADVEIENLRTLKNRIRREKNISIQRELEINLRARVNRYVVIVSSAMQQLARDESFNMLPTKEKEKILDWVNLSNGVRK